MFRASLEWRLFVHIVFAVILFVHGVAHLPGFLVPWKFLVASDMPYKTTLLSGRMHVGAAGIRAVGVVWLLLALLFVASAAGVGLRLPWWRPVVLWAAVASVLFSVLGWPDARVGVAVNVAILLFLAANHQGGWIG